MKDTLTIIETQNFQDFDAVIENLQIKEYFKPSRKFSWIILPKKFKKKLLTRDPEAMKSFETLQSVVFGSMLVLFLLCLLLAFGGLIASLFGFDLDRSPYLPITLGLLVATMFGFMTLMGFNQGFQDSLRELKKIRTPSQKGQLIYDHCKRILDSYENEYFDAKKEGSFAEQELSFQNKIHKCKGVLQRFEKHINRLDPEDPRYMDLHEGSNRAFAAWELMSRAHQAFGQRRERVLAGINMAKNKLDDLDFNLGSASLYSELNSTEQECADLLQSVEKRNFELACAFSEDFEKLKGVFAASRSYIDTVKGIDPLQISERNLLSAHIAGEELDKITEDLFLDDIVEQKGPVFALSSA